MDINKIKVGTRCKLLTNVLDLKAGQTVEICTESTFHTADIVPDRSGDYWVRPVGEGKFNYPAYCTCDKTDIEEYLKVLKY